MAKSKYISVKIEVSKRDKKFKATLITDDGKTKTIHFGAKGMSDFTKHKDPKRKERYLARHKKNENWNVPDTAGSLSRWVLWNKPTYEASVKDYKKKFKLK
tara:strand:- start:3052 stop:3354 length:303 start_codon:yes stop_codon:yes gene_type:complete